jgi:hypothetical protein
MLYNLAAECHFAFMKGFGETLRNSRWLTCSNYRLLNITYIILIFSFKYNHLQCIYFLKTMCNVSAWKDSRTSVEERSKVEETLGDLFWQLQSPSPNQSPHLTLPSALGCCWSRFCLPTNSWAGGNVRRDSVEVNTWADVVSLLGSWCSARTGIISIWPWGSNGSHLFGAWSTADFHSPGTTPPWKFTDLLVSLSFLVTLFSENKNLIPVTQGTAMLGKPNCCIQ